MSALLCTLVVSCGEPSEVLVRLERPAGLDLGGLSLVVRIEDGETGEAVMGSPLRVEDAESAVWPGTVPIFSERPPQSFLVEAQLVDSTGEVRARGRRVSTVVDGQRRFLRLPILIECAPSSSVPCGGLTTCGMGGECLPLCVTAVPSEDQLPRAAACPPRFVDDGGCDECETSLEGACVVNEDGSPCGACEDRCIRGACVPRRAPARFIASGANQTCVLRETSSGDGMLTTCWGTNDRGQLGIDNASERGPVNHPRILAAPIQPRLQFIRRGIDVGGEHVMAAADDDVLFAWGANEAGQLGRAEVSPMAQLEGSSVRFHSDPGVVLGNYMPAAGTRHGCAVYGAPEGSNVNVRLSSRKHIYCWGDNGRGQVGIDSDARTIPFNGDTSGDGNRDVIPEPFASAGEDTFCAPCADGADCTPRDRLCGAGNVLLDAWGDLTCASWVGVEGAELWCWGSAEAAAFGDGSLSVPVERPVGAPMPEVTEPIVDMAVGNNFVCFASSGSIFCRGSNDFGQLGRSTDGGDTAALSAVSAPADLFRVAAGRDTVCAIDVEEGLDGGSVYCWGRNLGGAAQPTSTDELVRLPTLVEGLGPMQAVAPGRVHSCAIDVVGRVFCWGGQADGSEQARPELLGGTMPGSEPVRVCLPADE